MASADSAAGDVAVTPPAEYAWLWELLTDPQLMRYKRKRVHVAMLIAYSGKKGTPGVLSQTDGHLATALGFGENLKAFQGLIDAMEDFNDLRAIVVDGARRYEISRDLVPYYPGDIRESDKWDTPRPRITVRNAPPHPLEMDPAPDGKRQRGGNRKWEIEATDAEKVAYSRFCAAERKEAEADGRERVEISRDKWVVWYRSRKSENESDVTFETPSDVTFAPENDVTFDQSKSYIGGSPLVTFASRDAVVVDSLVTERELQQQQSAGEAKVTDPKVTEAKVTSESVSKVTLDAEQQAVFAYLTSKGLWQEVARPAALWCDLATAHLYVDWVRSMKPTDFGKMLRYQIENQHPIPDDFRQGQARKELEAQRIAQTQQAAQQKADAESAIQTLIAQYWDSLAPDERTAHYYQAANLLPSEPRKWWKDYLRRRELERDLKPMKILQVQMDVHLERLLRDRMELPPYDKEHDDAPSRFVMPADWDGLLPEPGELPEGLGIPDLTEKEEI